MPRKCQPPVVDEREFEGLKASLIMLSNHYPEPERARIRAGLIDTMADQFARSGMEVPEWMERLRREM